MPEKGKNGKKKAHLFGFFRFYIPCAFFCILNLKIHIKKDKNAKKSIQIFSNCKNKHAKKHNTSFQRNKNGGSYFFITGFLIFSFFSFFQFFRAIRNISFFFDLLIFEKIAKISFFWRQKILSYTESYTEQ